MLLKLSGVCVRVKRERVPFSNGDTVLLEIEAAAPWERKQEAKRKAELVGD
jgi:hypothetical protein